MTHRALIAGVGKYGTFHAKAIASDALNKKMEVVAVCDCNVDSLIAFREKYPNIPVFLTPKDGDIDAENIQKAIDNNIDVYNDAGCLIEDMSCDTFVNATHNKSHLPILREALSVYQDGKPLIKMIFQEKPFAHLGEDASDVIKIIEDNEIPFNLNGVLTFSPIWEDFNKTLVAARKAGFEVQEVYCAYGKNRTKDTRPAPGGWAGMCGIHALDISTAADLKNLRLEPHMIRNQNGYLAEVAGDVNYETHLTAFLDNVRGEPVKLTLEGSFAWTDLHRHVQYILQNDAGHTMAMQIDFDVKQDGKNTDVLHTIVKNSDGVTISPLEKTVSTADKLEGFYQVILDEDDNRTVYDLPRAMAVQETLDMIYKTRPAATMPARKAVQGPVLKRDISTMQNKPVSLAERALKIQTPKL